MERLYENSSLKIAHRKNYIKQLWCVLHSIQQFVTVKYVGLLYSFAQAINPIVLSSYFYLFNKLTSVLVLDNFIF